MIKIIAFLIMIISLTSCATVKEKTKNIKEVGNIGNVCPPKEERTLKHIFCKETK